MNYSWIGKTQEGQLSAIELQKIADGDQTHNDYIEGFPHACKLFVKTSANIKKGKTFFLTNHPDPK